MKTQLANWQTTIAGALLAGLIAIQEASKGGDLANWKLWILPAAIALLGFVAKDATK